MTSVLLLWLTILRKKVWPKTEYPGDLFCVRWLDHWGLLIASDSLSLRYLLLFSLHSSSCVYWCFKSSYGLRAAEMALVDWCQRKSACLVALFAQVYIQSHLTWRVRHRGLVHFTSFSRGHFFRYFERPSSSFMSNGQVYGLVSRVILFIYIFCIQKNFRCASLPLFWYHLYCASWSQLWRSASLSPTSEVIESQSWEN